MENIATEVDLTRERVRQIFNRAMRIVYYSTHQIDEKLKSFNETNKKMEELVAYNKILVSQLNSHREKLHGLGIVLPEISEIDSSKFLRAEITTLKISGKTKNILTIAGIKNLGELIALAKRRPGQLNYASSGGGASPHLAMELLKQQAGVDIASIVYKGAGAQMVDHLAGRVEIAFAPAVGVMPFVKENRLRAIAVSTKERFPVLPAIPTASESGLKGYDASSWQGIVMPAGVALDIRQRMSDEIAKALKTAALRERVLDLGGVVVANSPDQFAAYYTAESEKWFKVARTAHVTID